MDTAAPQLVSPVASRRRESSPQLACQPPSRHVNNGLSAVAETERAIRCRALKRSNWEYPNHPFGPLQRPSRPMGATVHGLHVTRLFRHHHQRVGVSSGSMRRRCRAVNKGIKQPSEAFPGRALQSNIPLKRNLPRVTPVFGGTPCGRARRARMLHDVRKAIMIHPTPVVIDPVL